MWGREMMVGGKRKRVMEGRKRGKKEKGKGKGKGRRGKEGKARQVEGRIRARSLDCRGRGCSQVSLCWVSQVWQRLSPILPFRLRSLILIFCNRCSSPACTQSPLLHLRSSRLPMPRPAVTCPISPTSAHRMLFTAFILRRLFPSLAFFSFTFSHRYARSSFMRPLLSVPPFLFCSIM